MLALQRCRELLGTESDNLTDSELEALRAGLTALASVTVSAYSARTIVTPAQALSTLSSEERAEAEERAAILEFDAGLSRSAAEQLAVTEMLGRRGILKPLREIA